jgi:hypothetical protein
MRRVVCFVAILFFLCQSIFTTKECAAQCKPDCSLNDTCILILSPAASDTVTDGDTLHIKFVVKIDLVNIYISVDSAKSWKIIGHEAFTATGCTTSINILSATHLANFGVDSSVKIQPCKLRVAAYATGRPKGLSDGYFFVKRRATSACNGFFRLKKEIQESKGIRLYGINGQIFNHNNIVRHRPFIMEKNDRRKKIIFNPIR